MRVMVLVKATKESEAESHPMEMEGAEKMFQEMGRFNEELIKAGILLVGDGLKPSKFGKRIHFNGTKRSVTDGPFAEAKELVAGFWIWQVRSMEEAVEWAKRCPNPMPGPSDLEIRPIWEAEELGPEIAAGVNEQRAKLARNTEQDQPPSSGR
jgi:hypothetical protein